LVGRAHFSNVCIFFSVDAHADAGSCLEATPAFAFPSPKWCLPQGVLAFSDPKGPAKDPKDPMAGAVPDKLDYKKKNKVEPVVYTDKIKAPAEQPSPSPYPLFAQPASDSYNSGPAGGWPAFPPMTCSGA
jgi:hypothetical protein